MLLDFIWNRVWKNELSKQTPQRNCFNLLKKTNKEFLEPEDFKPILKSNSGFFVKNLIFW